MRSPRLVPQSFGFRRQVPEQTGAVLTGTDLLKLKLQFQQPTLVDEVTASGVESFLKSPKTFAKELGFHNGRQKKGCPIMGRRKEEKATVYVVGSKKARRSQKARCLIQKDMRPSEKEVPMEVGELR